MVSPLHESLVRFVRDHPRLTLDLVRGALGPQLPRRFSVEVSDGNLTVLPHEYRADLVLILRRRRAPVLGVIPEVQLKVDPDKRASWPTYAVTLRARLTCPVVVLVITPSPAVARWARTPIPLGPGNIFTPVVLGPDDVPAIVDPGAARADPLAAVLSALTHARSPDAQAIARAALRGLDAVEDVNLWVYCDMILKSAAPADREGLHAMLNSEDYKPKSKFIRDLIAESRKEGRQEGRQEGRLEGRQKTQEALTKTLRQLLAKRHITLRPSHEAKIAKATPQQLTRWILKAADATSVTDVFPRR